MTATYHKHIAGCNGCAVNPSSASRRGGPLTAVYREVRCTPGARPRDPQGGHLLPNLGNHGKKLKENHPLMMAKLFR